MAKGQKWFVEKRKLLVDTSTKPPEKPYIGNMDGMCFGVAIEGMQAYLVNQMNVFAKRYQVLNDIPSEKLFTEVFNAKEQLKQWSHTAIEEAQKKMELIWKVQQIKLDDKQKQTQLNVEIQKNIQSLMKSHFDKQKAPEEEAERFHALIEMDAAAQTVEIHFQSDIYEITKQEHELYLMSKLPSEGDTYKYDNAYVFIDEDPPKLYQLHAHEKPTQLKIDDEKSISTMLKQFKDIKETEPIQKQLKTVSADQASILWDMIAKNEGHVKKARYVAQELSNSAPFVTSQDLQKKGGFCQLAQFSGFYTKDELKNYFHGFYEAMKKEEPPSQPIALLLKSSTHAITVGYNNDRKSLIIINPNRLPFEEIKESKSMHEEIATKLMSSFNCVNGLALTTEVFTTKQNELKHTPSVQEWQNQKEMKEMHVITPARAQSIDQVGGTWLYRAAFDGDVQLVEQLIKADAHLLKQGLHPLRAACENNRIHVVRSLLAANVEVNALGDDNTNALYTAAQNGHCDIVRQLLEKKADPNIAREKNAETPLYIAAMKGYGDIVRQLLKKDAKPNMKCKSGATPLIMASYTGDRQIVQDLLDAGADVNAISNNGLTAVDCAIAGRHYGIARMLLQRMVNEIQVLPGNSNQKDLIEKIQNEIIDEKNIFKIESKCKYFKSLDNLARSLYKVESDAENKDQINQLKKHVGNAYDAFSEAKEQEWEKIVNELRVNASSVAQTVKNNYETNHSWMCYFTSSTAYTQIQSSLAESAPSKQITVK